jgi:sulfate adenylyltransferase
MGETERRPSPRSVVLNDDQVDLVELTLSGALSVREFAAFLHLAPSPHGATAGEGGAPGDATLLDGENTPIALLSGATLSPLKPLATGVGPAWRADLRISPAQLRSDLRAQGAAGSVFALPLSYPPTDADLDQAAAAANAAGAQCLVIAALAPRAPQRPGEIGAAALARCAVVAADKMRRAASPALTLVLPIVIPHPRNDTAGSPAPELDAVLTAYGITSAAPIIKPPADGVAQTASGFSPAIWAEVELSQRNVNGRGATILFTGLSGSGKSTIARALAETLRGDGYRVTLLDGDAMRRAFSADLGFDRASRNTNLARIGEAAAREAASGQIVIAAPIAPFNEGRAAARAAASAVAPFLLVYVSTPLEICEARDRKGLYAKARSGEISDFTGISSPFEVPTDADLSIDASKIEIAVAVQRVKDQLLPLL